MCESINKIFFVFFYLIILISCNNNDKKYNSWTTYGGDPSGSKYSSLDEINVRNVNNLKLLWTYKAFDKNEKHKNGIQCNPIVIDDRIYLIGPDFNVHSINAENGDLIWKYNPFEEKKISGTIRGVTYYNDGKNGRIFFVAESLLFCLNAKTGQLINSFGSGGKTTINKGFERNTADLLITATSPGIIYEDLLILGSRVSDSHNKKTIPGDIRAFDVFSGDIVWTFNTIPRPGEIGYETWPKDSWKNEYLSVNSWGGFTLDEENGIVFFGTGSPSYDHWGGNRIGDNLFGNCILALNAKNGKRIWHFQTVHHDLWDYDVPCPPNLVEVKIDGKYRKAIAQPTKTGQLFVLDRFTGNPIHPIIEKLVKNSEIPGEITSKTQPFTKPELIYAKNRIENYFNKIDQFEFKGIEDSLIKMNFGELFIPPSEKPTIVFPQFNGGTDWGGAAYDKINRMVYVNNSNEAEWFAMVNLNKVKQTNQTFEIPWIANGHKELKTKNGYPVNDMPWGTLSGINLDLGEIIWQVPLGTYPELEKQGLSPTGTFNMGGPIVTAGGLVFIGATMDERFRAFDKKDGSLMWEYQLEAGAYATPSTFQVNGKQFVIIAGGGQGKPGTKSGNKLYCFGL